MNGAGSLARTLTAAVAAVCALIAVGPNEVTAQAPVPTAVDPQALVDEGNRLFRAGDPGAALLRYRAAHEQTGDHALRYMIARCLQESGQLAQAEAEFEAFLAGDAPPAARQKAEGHLATVRKGLRAQAEPAPPLPRPDISQPGPPPPKRTYYPWNWITLGVGGVFVATGTVSYVLGKKDHDDIEDTHGWETGHGMSPTRVQELEDSGDAKKLTGYLLWGLGGAALVTSTVLFVMEPDPDEESTALGLIPTEGGGMFVLGGTF